jgi:hypothetical protein
MLSLCSLSKAEEKTPGLLVPACARGCQLARLHVSSNLPTRENTSLRGRWACMLLPRTPTPSPPHAHAWWSTHSLSSHADGSWHPLATTLRMLAVGLSSAPPPLYFVCTSACPSLSVVRVIHSSCDLESLQCECGGCMCVCVRAARFVRPQHTQSGPRRTARAGPAGHGRALHLPHPCCTHAYPSKFGTFPSPHFVKQRTHR